MKKRFFLFHGFKFSWRGVNCEKMRSQSHQSGSRHLPDETQGRFSGDDLDRLLSSPRPAVPVPTELHESIMRSVEREQRHEMGRRRSHWLRPVLVGVAAMALAIGVVAHYRSVSHHQMDSVLREQISATWSFIDGFGTNAPVILTKSIATNYSELTNDLHQTTKNLLASFP
jgi:hypothetical protein